MKAAVLVKQNAPLEVVDVEIPKLDVGQVLVKVEFSGICGKQIDEITGRQGDDPHIPHLLGHEGAGVVVDTGPGVTKVKDGDRVVLHWMKGSGIDSRPPRFMRNGETLSAGWVTTFSEFTVASENRVTVVDPDFDGDILALLGCAVTTGLGIVFNDARLLPGQSIAVIGVGGIGLNVVQGASLVNAYPIVAVDVAEDKLETARAFGATHLVNAAKDDTAEALMDLSHGAGFDVVVENTGHTAVRVTAYETTSNRGTTVFAGVPMVGERISIDSFPLHFGRRLVGSHGGDTVPEVDIPRYLSLYRQGKLKLRELIGGRFSLDDINDAVETVREGRTCGRCVIHMEAP
jgi:S-(hydroxymethyl)glutathione dehydrogenase / alcohol dehydrogenase